MTQRYKADELRELAVGMLTAAGLNMAHAKSTAATLVEADLLGYTTHGIQFLPQYCRALETGGMACEGEMTLSHDTGASLIYDAENLSGPWCVAKAVAEVLGRSDDHGTVTALVRRSHNTACLATYLLPVIDAGRIGLIFVSSPDGRAVSPPGGRGGRYSTNPLAAGFPTGGDPVLIDMATSATTNRNAERLAREKEPCVGEPMLDAEGRPSNDPTVLTGNGGGSIRPLGGDLNEHKGFALALMVEALSSALAGSGHAMTAETGNPAGSNTFIQIINPDAFAGRTEFLREMDALRDWLVATPPRPGSDGVRLPGQRAFATRREYLEKGVVLHPSIRPHVEPVAESYGLKFPDSVA